MMNVYLSVILWHNLWINMKEIHLKVSGLVREMTITLGRPPSHKLLLCFASCQCQANIRSYFLCMTESDQRIKILKNPDGSPRNFTVTPGLLVLGRKQAAVASMPMNLQPVTQLQKRVIFKKHEVYMLHV